MTRYEDATYEIAYESAPKCQLCGEILLNDQDLREGICNACALAPIGYEVTELGSLHAAHVNTCQHNEQAPHGEPA